MDVTHNPDFEYLNYVVCIDTFFSYVFPAAQPKENVKIIIVTMRKDLLFLLFLIP